MPADGMHESAAVGFAWRAGGESFETTKLPWVSQMSYCEQLLNMTLNTKTSEEVMLGKEKVKGSQTNEYI